MSSRTKRAIVWRIIFRRKGNAHTQREPTELFLQSLSGRRCIGRSFIFYFVLFHFRLEKRRRRGNRACSQACIGPPLNYYSLSAAANTARRAEVPPTRKVTLFTRLPNSTLCWTGAGWMAGCYILSAERREFRHVHRHLLYRSRTTFNSSITNKEQRGGKRNAGRWQPPNSTRRNHLPFRFEKAMGRRDQIYKYLFKRKREEREREKDDPLKAGTCYCKLVQCAQHDENIFFSFSRLATFRRATQSPPLLDTK